MKLVTIVRFGKKKKLCISILIYFLKLMRNISKDFLGGGVLLSSIIDINCSAAQRAGARGADQNRMAVDVRGGNFRKFCRNF